MRLGILGGTFDPIHNGHILIAQQAVQELHLDKLILLPTGTPYHKQTDGADKWTRYEMAQCAAEEFGFGISDYEIKRDTPSYTVESMKYFQSNYPNARIVFIVGADSLDYIDQWKDSRTLLSMVEIAAAGRSGSGDMKQKKQKLEREFHAVVHLLHNDFVAVSSSSIRRRMKKGESVEGMVPQSVWDYLKQHQVYQND